MKAPTRVRDLTTGELRYRWTETGPLEHYRHAHAFDHIAAEIARQNPPPACSGLLGDPLDSELLANYDGPLHSYPGDDYWLRR